MRPVKSQDIHRLNNKRLGFAAAHFLCFIAAVVLTMNAPQEISPSFCWAVLGLVGVILAIMINWKMGEPRPINWISPETIFTGSFIVVHFTYILLWNTNIYDLGQPIWFFRAAHCPHVVCKTLAMCAACLAIFHSGYHLVRVRPHNILKIATNPALKHDWQKLGAVMARVSLLLICAFIVLLGGRYLGGNYSGTNMFGLLPNIIFQVFQGLIVASIGILVLSRASLRGRTRRVVVLDTVLILFATMSLLLHGDRSTFLMIVVAGVASVSEFIRPIKIRTAVLSFVVLFALFGISSMARTAGSRTIRGFIDVSNEGLGKSIEVSARQFGSSVLCAFVAVDLVPAKHYYYFGQLKTNELCGILPFGRRIFGVKQSPDTSSSMLFTKLIQGRVGRGVAGAGSSVFGDIYLEVGFWGTALVFWIWGILFKWISEKSKSSNNLLWKVALISLLSTLAISGRYALLGLLIRQVAYPALYIFAFATFLRIPLKMGRPRVPEPELYPQRLWTSQ